MKSEFFKFLHQEKNTRARAGKIHTAHGDVLTPSFCPVGTQGTVKALRPDDLTAMNIQMILGNTYHLYLRPGLDVIQKFGGLHRFMGWTGPILTDSGGYQVFSLEENMKIMENGVEFRSHLDGSTHFFSPEKVVKLEAGLNSDIAMVLDECPPYPAERGYVKTSMLRTIRWAEESLAAHTLPSQQLWAIVQGGMFRNLREECAKRLVDMDFPGYALGGLSVGEPRPLMMEVLEYALDFLPANKPRYVMGVGTPADILHAVECGTDLFDCALPTRNARNGTLFTFSGKVMMRNTKHRLDDSPIEEGCACYTCTHFSRSYIRHLLNVKEMLGYTLTTLHNLYFMETFMKRMRAAISDNRFTEFKRDFLSGFSS